MSLLQAGVSSSRGNFSEADGPGHARHGRAAPEAAAVGAPHTQQHPFSRLAEFLQIGGTASTAGATQLDELPELPDSIFSASWLSAFLFMSLAAIALLLGPELVLYRDTAYGAIHGCKPSGEPFPGLRHAAGDPSRSGFAGGAGGPPLRLCPGLEVPDDSYCTLVVPVRPLRLGPLEATSLDGTVLLRVLPHAAPGAEALPGGLPGRSFRRLLTLMTKQGMPLAHCDEAASTPRGRPSEFQLYAEGGEGPASMAFGRAQNQYVLSLPTGGRACFQGSSDFSAINVTDGAGHRLASAKMCKCKFDPAGDYCCIRVEPGADAGLVLCGLLCINHVGDFSL